MGIIQNFNEGNMQALRTISYEAVGAVSPYVNTTGGALRTAAGVLPPLPDAITRRIDDLTRITKLLVDKPGLQFLGNQLLLSQAEIERKIKAAAEKKRDAGGTGVGQVISGLAAGVGAAAGIVLKVGASTLAQVPVNGTGTHFLRGFKTDTYLQPGGADPATGLGTLIGIGGLEGAPIALEGGIIIPDNDGDKIATFTPLHKSELEDKNSKFSSRIDLNDGVDQLSKPTLVSNDLFSDTERTTQLIDFRKLKYKGYNSNTFNLKYNGEGSEKIVKELRVGLGNQGKKKPYFNSYLDADLERIDKLNAQKVSTEPLSGAVEVRDLISLNFELITPEQSYYLYFRAFLDEFSDSFSSDWGTTKYIGRAEDFYTYNGFTRQIGIGFKVAAATRSELNPIYQKISVLASVTTPTYGGVDSRFMRGTIARVTVGDYLYKVPGIIDSVEFSWQTDYPWEINMQGPEGKEDNMPVVPHLLDCRVNFKPIHDFIPQLGAIESPALALIRNNPNKSYETEVNLPPTASIIDPTTIPTPDTFKTDEIDELDAIFGNGF